jgi:hypothetical protein
MLGTPELGLSSRRVVSEIVRLLTPRYPALDAESQAHVHGEVVRFVSAQIGALPDFLRGPYLLAIRMFDLLPLVRYGRRFVALREDAKAAYLALWSEGKLPPMRNFVKLIRGCALLAYFDHPIVTRALEAERASRVEPHDGRDGTAATTAGPIGAAPSSTGAGGAASSSTDGVSATAGVAPSSTGAVETARPSPSGATPATAKSSRPRAIASASPRAVGESPRPKRQRSRS